MKYRHVTILSAFLFLSITAHAGSRETILINDNWEFSLPNNKIDKSELDTLSWEKVNIPHTWNNKDIQSGERPRYGTGWYKRDLDMTGMQADRQYYLRFEAVGNVARVYINEEFAGEHTGSYSAFALDISRFLKADTINSILVEVNNELGEFYPKDNYLFGLYGGIYRNVSLINTSKQHIALLDDSSPGVYIHQDKISSESASLRIVSKLKNNESKIKKLILRNKLQDKEGNVVAENEDEISLFPGGLTPYTSQLEVNKPHLWNGKKDPYLYTLVTEVVLGNDVIDRTEQVTGLRYYSIDPNKGFILNGKPYRLYGVCRHQEWEDYGNALQDWQHREDMEMINEIGATSIRLAHYQQAEYFYQMADSLGILVWAEIPFVNGYRENADWHAKQQLRELIKQNFNHPSIFVWGLHNEVLKNNIVTGPVELTKQLHSIAKDLDPSRYTVSVSNLWWLPDHPIHELADLQGYNQYTGWYGGKPHELGGWIRNYHKKKPHVRFSISEYGAGGNISHQSDNLTPPDPKSPFFSEGYMTYYHEQTWAAIKKSPYVWSSYIWNMFDFSVPEWDRGGIKGRNHKGLVTYDRNTKKDAFYWYKANWNKEPVLYLTGRRHNKLPTGKRSFSAYSNHGTPVLYIDGKKIGNMLRAGNSVKYSTPPVRLKKGSHNIEVKLEYKGKTLSDKYSLTVGK